MFVYGAVRMGLCVWDDCLQFLLCVWSYVRGCMIGFAYVYVCVSGYICMSIVCVFCVCLA